MSVGVAVGGSQTRKAFLDRADKFAVGDRYPNLSIAWIPYRSWVMYGLYRLGIPHEAVTAASIGCGLAAALAVLVADGRAGLVVAAVLFHAKDVLDACDGGLARATGRGHRIGRFLDTIGDFVTITLVVAACTWYAATTGSGDAGVAVAALGALTVASIFLQGSYFNYYQLAYVARLGEGRLSSRLDERMDAGGAAGWRGALLAVLVRVYRLVFGWQDRAMACLDRWARRVGRVHDPRTEAAWYADRRFLVANSLLLYGTPIFLICVSLVAGVPLAGLVAVTVGLNAYWAAVLAVRIASYRARQRRGSAPVGSGVASPAPEG